jgi:hypothetical protein
MRPSKPDLRDDVGCPKRRTAPRGLTAAACLAIATTTGLACIAPLDDEFTGGAGDGSDASAGDDDAAIAPGCLPFGVDPGVAGVSGDLRSVAMAEGGSLWVASQADMADGGVTLAAAFGVSGAAAPGCAWSSTLEGTAIDPSPLDPAGLLVVLDMVQTAQGLAAYYVLFASDPTMAFGLRLLGYGVAPQDAATGRFSPTGELLWSGDRPSYGSSALVAGGWLYVHGCKSNAPLTDDCYVARVDPASIASAAAYVYWTGSAWSSNPDDAVPIASAGGTVSVRPDPAGKPRFLMTYVAPFGTSLIARSAIAPEGPWSAPAEVARCVLDPAIPGAFCGGGEQHPEVMAGSGQMVLSYDDRTFSAEAGADAHGFWPEVVAVSVPADLP